MSVRASSVGHEIDAPWVYFAEPPWAGEYERPYDVSWDSGPERACATATFQDEQYWETGHTAMIETPKAEEVNVPCPPTLQLVSPRKRVRPQIERPAVLNPHKLPPTWEAKRQEDLKAREDRIGICLIRLRDEAAERTNLPYSDAYVDLIRQALDDIERRDS